MTYQPTVTKHYQQPSAWAEAEALQRQGYETQVRFDGKHWRVWADVPAIEMPLEKPLQVSDDPQSWNAF